jgi:hypothetical protein
MHAVEASLTTLLLAMLLTTPASHARDYALIEGGVDEAWDALRNLPPAWSWDGEMGFGYGDVPAWRRYNAQYVLMGGRISFGKHLKNPAHRVGGTLTSTLDGPVPITFAWVVEPGLAWDAVLGKLQVGTTLGYATSYNANNQLIGWETNLTTGPALSFRVGYSQPWSQVTRRMHVFVEPKVRLIGGLLAPSATLFVGSGRGL